VVCSSEVCKYHWSTVKTGIDSRWPGKRYFVHIIYFLFLINNFITKHGNLLSAVVLYAQWYYSFVVKVVLMCFDHVGCFYSDKYRCIFLLALNSLLTQVHCSKPNLLITKAYVLHTCQVVDWSYLIFVHIFSFVFNRYILFLICCLGWDSMNTS